MSARIHSYSNSKPTVLVLIILATSLLATGHGTLLYVPIKKPGKLCCGSVRVYESRSFNPLTSTVAALPYRYSYKASCARPS